MKIFHSIKATVFVKENEDAEEIKNKLLELFPFDLEKEKIKINIQKAKGFEDKTIHILTINLDKQKNIQNFVENLFSKLKQAQLEQVLDELKTRIDDNCIFYIRFEKDSWQSDKKLFIIDKGNCFHIKFKIAAYPSKKQTAIEIMQRIISAYTQKSRKLQTSVCR